MKNLRVCVSILILTCLSVLFWQFDWSLYAYLIIVFAILAGEVLSYFGCGPAEMPFAWGVSQLIWFVGALVGIFTTPKVLLAHWQSTFFVVACLLIYAANWELKKQIFYFEEQYEK